MNKDRNFTMRLDDEDWQRLETISKLLQKSKTDVIREFLRAMEKNLYDIYRTGEVADATEQSAD